MQLELFRRVDFAQVAKVVFADEPLDGVSHQVDVELQTIPVDSSEAFLPFRRMFRQRARRFVRSAKVEARGEERGDWRGREEVLVVPPDA